MDMNVKYVCFQNDYIPLPSQDVYQIDTFDQFQKLVAFFGEPPSEEERMTEEEWKEQFRKMKNGPWVDFVIEKDNQIVARANIWHFQNDSSEIGCVRTVPEYQNRGFCTQIVSRCTEYILQKGSVPIGITAEDNLAMRRVFEKIGYHICVE